MNSSPTQFRIVMPCVQLLLGAGATYLLVLGLLNGVNALIMTAAISGVLLNLIVATLTARRDLAAGFYAALAFGAAALVLALLSMGNAKPFIFWLLVTVMAITPGMAGVWGVFMYRRQQILNS